MVIAIIGILIGLLPARGAEGARGGRRAAVHQQSEADWARRPSLPRFQRGIPQPESVLALGPIVPTHTLFMDLLPYVEQQSQVLLAAATNPNRLNDVKPISTYLCPTRRDTSVGARTDYAAPWHPTAGGFPQLRSILGTADVGGGQIFRGTNFGEVVGQDGTSNTLLVGHRGQSPRYYHSYINSDGTTNWTAWDYDYSWAHFTNPGATARCGIGFRPDKDMYAYPPFVYPELTSSCGLTNEWGGAGRSAT